MAVVQIDLGEPLGQDYFSGCVDEVAAKLIGCFLFREEASRRYGGQIIETEAYCENDDAAHCHLTASKRRKNKSDPMRLPGGHFYIHKDRPWCMNLTCGLDNFGSAVLIRALLPIGDPEELSLMRQRRLDWYPSIRLKSEASFKNNLCNGPCNLCLSLGVTGECYNTKPIHETDIKVYAQTPGAAIKIKCGPRMHIPPTKKAAGWPRRYVLADEAISDFLVSWSKADTPFPPERMAQLKATGELSSCKCSTAC